MKITKVETLLLSRMHEVERQWVTSRFRVIKADCPIVVIHTDEARNGSALIKCQSAGFVDAARTLIRTSLSLGAGFSNSLSLRTSAEPYSV